MTSNAHTVAVIETILDAVDTIEQTDPKNLTDLVYTIQRIIYGVSSGDFTDVPEIVNRPAQSWTLADTNVLLGFLIYLDNIVDVDATTWEAIEQKFRKESA